MKFYMSEVESWQPEGGFEVPENGCDLTVEVTDEEAEKLKELEKAHDEYRTMIEALWARGDAS